MTASGHHRHDTEQRVTQILNEAKAAMNAVKDDRSETQVDDGTMSSDENFNRDIISTTRMPSEGGNRTVVETCLRSSPPDTGVDEGNPRDVVARIYREELLKLTEMAQASGNMAEFAMYESELERLSKRNNMLPVVKVTARPKGAKTFHRVAAKKVIKTTLGVTRVTSEEQGVVNDDIPEDLTTTCYASRKSPANSLVLDLRNDAPDVNRSMSDNPSSVVKEHSPVSCSRTPVVCNDRHVKIVKLEIQELETAGPQSGMECDQSPLDLMQTIADSVANKSNKKCAGVSASLETSRASLPPITAEQLKRCANLDTEDIVVAVRTTLADYSISQRLFGEAVLGLSQGSVSDLLARPKPWPLLTSKGREPFIRMRMFLDDPESAVRRLVATQYKVPADKLLRSTDSTDSEVVPEARKRKNSVDSSSNDGASTQSKKQPRVNFTPEQKEALRRAYDADPYPTQLSIDRLAAELGIGPRTVVNWFHNHRMRYAKQQYAATGIWSVTGVNYKHETSDPELDQSSMNGYDHDSTTDAGSSTDQAREEFDLSMVCGMENSSEECISESANLNSQSASVGCGSNRRKSARPQRLGTPDGQSGSELGNTTLLPERVA